MGTHSCSIMTGRGVRARVSPISHRQNCASTFQARNVSVILTPPSLSSPRFTGDKVQLILLKPPRWVSSFSSLLPLFVVSLTQILHSFSCLPLLSSHFNPVFKGYLNQLLKIQLSNSTKSSAIPCDHWMKSKPLSFSLEASIIWPPPTFWSLLCI